MPTFCLVIWVLLTVTTVGFVLNGLRGWYDYAFAGVAAMAANLSFAARDYYLGYGFPLAEASGRALALGVTFVALMRIGSTDRPAAAAKPQLGGARFVALLAAYVSLFAWSDASVALGLIASGVVLGLLSFELLSSATAN